MQAKRQVTYGCASTVSAVRYTIISVTLENPKITLGVGNATRLVLRDTLLMVRAPPPGRAAFSRGPSTEKISSRHAHSRANCATLKGAQESDGLILAAQRRPGAAPCMPRAQRSGRVAVSPSPGTTAFSRDLCNDRYPHLCEPFLGVCLVELHPYERDNLFHRLENVVERCELVLESVQHTVVSLASREFSQSRVQTLDDKARHLLFHFVGIEAWSIRFGDMRFDRLGSRRGLHFDVRDHEHTNAQMRGFKTVKKCYHPIPARSTGSCRRSLNCDLGLEMSAARQTSQHY